MEFLAERQAEELFRCMKCGNCREVCPVFLETGDEAMVARGRVRLLKAYLEGGLELTDGLRDRIYTCLSCNACRIKCPCGIEVEEVVEASRAGMVRAGMVLPSAQQALRERIDSDANPFGEKRSERGAWLPEAYRKPRPAPVVVHAGCAISYANNRLGKMLLRIVEQTDADFMLMGDEEQCCGDPILRMGEVERAEAQFRRNIEEYRKWDVETIVTPCAGCVKTFKRHYAETGGFQVRHSMEWLAELIRAGQLKPQKEIAKRVAYFDGCDIGRHSGIYEAPREVLRAIPGLELVEFPAHHDMARCCGGPLMAADPDMAARIASRRVREAIDVGADAIAVACPTCLINLKEGANVLGQRMDIQDVTALLHRAVK